MANEKFIKKINYNGTEYEVGIQSVATTSENGLMSARDKTDFDAGVLIAGNTVNLGGSLDANTLRNSLGLSNAMHFRGIATIAISDGSTTDPGITGYTFSSAQAGDVVIDKNSAWEYVWTGSKWEKLGPDSYGLSINDHTISIVPGGTTISVTVPDNNDNTWQANTASQNGYVTAGSGNGNRVWKTDASGNPGWREDANNTYSLATYNNLGLVKPAYTSTGAASLTTTAASNTTTPTIAAKSTTSGRYYGVEADKNGVLFVNVPWANDNTWTKVSTSSDGYISKLSGNTSQFLRGDGTWATPPDTKYATAKSDTNGLVKLFSDTVQSVAANAVTTTANRTYGVQLNNSGQMVVNVPWSNTNTWNAMTGATAEGNGTVGYINAVPPSDGYNTKYWRADGTWAVPKDTTYAAATNSTFGLVKLTSTTKQTVAAQQLTTQSNRTYAVQFNNDNQLVVNVPWIDNNTDTKVTQGAAITTAGAYPVLLGKSTSTGEVTDTVNKTSTLTYNPNTKTLVAENITGTASKATADASGNTITTTYATKTELNNLIAAQDVMVFKGVLGTGTNMGSIPAVPYDKGWVYRVGTAGTYAGKTCEVGDVVICVVDRASGATGSNDDWIAIQANVDKPAYFANTTPGANKVIIAVNSAGQVQASDYTIGASVPSDAKFTDTTYGAEKGISLASGKFGHSNTAITAQTTQAVYPIKIDTYGHITGYGAAQTILALGTTATTAAAGNHNHDATYVNVSGDTMTGALLVGTKAMTVSAGKVTEIGNGQTGLFKDGIAISNPTTKNDAGWIRVTGTGESDTVLEIATGDDAGAGEKIVARQYNTSNAVAKEAEILGINGVTTFPVSVTAPTFYGNLDWSYIQSKPTILTIGTTATTAAAGNHTHTTTLATDTGTSTITLASGGKYKLTAGGTSVIFTMPTSNNYSHPTGDGNLHVPATGTSNNGKFLKAGSTAGSISWASLSSSDITTALGFTPYNATNPNGYTSNTGTITGVTGSDGLTGSGTSGSVTIKHAAPSTSPAKTTSAVYPITIDKYGHITAAGTAVTIPAAVSVKGNAESSYRTGQVNLTPANLGISATTTSVTVGSTTFSKYTHPTYTSKTSGLYKITVDGTGHVSAATAVAKADITALGIPGSDTDTKNTAGSTDTSSKIFLIGATSQAANPQTYSDNQVYATNGQLDANKVRVAEKVTLEYNSTTESLDFIFA